MTKPAFDFEQFRRDMEADIERVTPKPKPPPGPESASKPKEEGEGKIAELAKLSPLAYELRRKQAAKDLGIGCTALDKIVAPERRKAQSRDTDNDLPHWKVEPWPDEVPGAALLDGVKTEFEKYIVLPAGAGDALSLWVLHAWTMDAGDISPFMVLVSPAMRCGKTSVLIVLLYLTPRSELAANITASALFRYVEEVRPTLLIDEGDSFLNGNEEMRGILNSGHTRAAAHVIRNVEVNGEHKPKRFSTWAPKAIATIRKIADTLEDRAVVLQLQRKPKTAKVARLRKRDCAEFALLRRKAARWAADNFNKLADPDPKIPDALNDRAADNWRPLLAIADLAGGGWPRRARDAACLLSGEGHEASSINVELLADIRRAFGDKDALRSVDLVADLNADPERPWVEWKHGKPLTQKQLGGLLRSFGILSETVSIPGLADAKGYKRVRFEEAWEVYLPGQNTFSGPVPPSQTSKRRNADGTGTSSDFGSVAGDMGDGSKSDDLSHSRTGSDASMFREPVTGAEGILTSPPGPLDARWQTPGDPAEMPSMAAGPTPEPTPAALAAGPAPALAEVAIGEWGDGSIPAALRRCAQCNAPGDASGAVTDREVCGVCLPLHAQCHRHLLGRPEAGRELIDRVRR